MFFFFENLNKNSLSKIPAGLAKFIFQDYLNISSKLNINFNDKR